MTYKTEVKDKVRVVTAKIDKKLYPAIPDDKYIVTVPLSIEDGAGKRGYKPIQVKFTITETSKLMQFHLPVTLDRISAVEIIITMVEHLLGNQIK